MGSYDAHEWIGSGASGRDGSGRRPGTLGEIMRTKQTFRLPPDLAVNSPIALGASECHRRSSSKPRSRRTCRRIITSGGGSTRSSARPINTTGGAARASHRHFKRGTGAVHPLLADGHAAIAGQRSPRRRPRNGSGTKVLSGRSGAGWPGPSPSPRGNSARLELTQATPMRSQD